MGGNVVWRRFCWAVGLLAVVSGAAGCGDEPRLGHVSVSAAVVDDSHCPTIHAMAAQPGKVYVGSQINLRVIASAAKANDTLAYSWSPAGIAEATAPTASYTCLTPGSPVVTIKVTETSNVAGACSVEEALPVTCLAGP